MPLPLSGRLACVLLVLPFSLAACKTIERNNAIQTERLLAAAGFQMRMADSPNRTSELTALPIRKLVPTHQDGNLRFVYADDLGCKCIYVGTEKAYQRYQRLVVKQQIANQQMEAALSMETMGFDWEGWGPWYEPWY